MPNLHECPKCEKPSTHYFRCPGYDRNLCFKCASQIFEENCAELKKIRSINRRLENKVSELKDELKEYVNMPAPTNDYISGGGWRR